MAINLAWQSDFARDPCIGGYKLLDNLPARIEDLHEAAVIWQRADDEVILTIMPNPIRRTFARGYYPDPKPPRAFEMLGVDLDCGPNPAVCVGHPDKKISLPDPGNTPRKEPRLAPAPKS